MRFVQFYTQGSKLLQLGLKTGEEEIISLSNLISQKSLLDVLKSEDETLLDKIKTFASNETTERIPLSSVTLTSPILSPDKLICVGMNYRDHCEEQNVPVPVEPIIFSKFSSSIVGPNDPIPYPQLTKELDYEVELGFVIGKRAKNVSEKDALSHVFGYTVAHDVSARDWQFRKNGGQWLLGKTMDAFCPLGPEIVTTEEMKDPHNLFIRCKVNDETVQDSNTSQMVHRVEAILSFVSKICTLLPGDVIITGTPPGVGVFRKPQKFLKIGDVVECSIEGLGTIRNEIIAE